MPMMNQPKFMKQYVYRLSSDFTSLEDGSPAVWAPNQPQKWGSEFSKIKLDAKASATALSVDDTLLAVAVGNLIQIYTLPDCKLQQVLTGDTEKVGRIAFAPIRSRQGHTLISYSEKDIKEGHVILWELNAEGKDIHAPKSIDIDGITKKATDSVMEELSLSNGSKAGESLEVAFKNAIAKAVAQKGVEGRTILKGSLRGAESDLFSQDGTLLMTVLNNKTTQLTMREPELLPTIEVWSMNTRTLIHRLSGHTDSIMWIGSSHDSTKIASSAWDGTVRIWDLKSGACLHEFGNFGGQMWTGAWSPDSKYLSFSQGNKEKLVYVYDTQTGEEISRFDGFKHWSRSMDWSPDGKLLVSAGRAGLLCVIDPMTGEELMRWELTFDDEEKMMKGFASISGVRFVGSGKKLIFKSSEGTVEVYDFNTNLKSQFSRGPDDKVDSMTDGHIDVSTTGNFIVSADADNSVRIWKL